MIAPEQNIAGLWLTNNLGFPSHQFCHPRVGKMICKKRIKYYKGRGEDVLISLIKWPSSAPASSYFGASVRRSSGWRSGGRLLAMT